MSHSNIQRAGWALAIVVLLLAFGVAHSRQAKESDETRILMQGIFDSISTVLPLSLENSKFEDPANRDVILAELRRLNAGGESLQAHGLDRDAGFQSLSRSLSSDTAAILENFEAGRFSESRFLLHEVTQTCAACHSRLPEERISKLADRFVDSQTVAQLSLAERAQLLVATRQFERAAVTYEALMASPESDPASLDLEGHLDDYLELCIRVLRDSERPRTALEQFLRRPDMNERIRVEVDSWIASLDALNSDAAAGPPLERARRLVGESESFAMSPEERAALVRYFAASGILHSFVRSGDASPSEFAEAYYLLGLIESRVGRSFWISETEAYLEASIRAEPGGPYAERAYTLLEEFVVAGYSGSAGTNVPPSVQAWLEELRSLAAARPEVK